MKWQNLFLNKIMGHIISQRPNLFKGIPRIWIFILFLIVWVRSFSNVLPALKFVEDKVLVFVILREKNAKTAQL